MEYESVVVTIVVALIASVAGGFIAWLFKGKERKDSTEEKAVALDLAKRDTADKLEEKTKRMAEQVKRETMDDVNQLFASLRSEIALETQKIYSIMEKREIKIDQIRKDFEQFRSHLENIIDKLQKSIELIQTMAWGADAKSVLPAMTGEDETSEHKAEPGKGAFYQQTEWEQEQQREQNEERMRKEKED